MTQRSTHLAIDAFRQRFDAEPVAVVRAPGRVNLIGEHTDYNDGFVLPMALPFDTTIALRPRSDSTVDVESVGFGIRSFDADASPHDTEGWARYLHGMATALTDRGYAISGWEGSVATTIPAGASLSSSAALEVAAGLAHTAAAGQPTTDMVELAHMGKWVENDLMGLPSGILDQLASATGAEGMASLIDCRDLSLRHTPLPSGTTVVVMDTGTRRELVESEYADRQATCAAAAARLGIASLRDAQVSDLDRLTDVELRRTRHVITENERTLAAAEAMASDDPATLGTLMNASHDSLSGDYAVSGPALDEIVRVARLSPGCFGARMTGGGFAGCAIALVDDDQLDAFIAAVQADFDAPTTQPAVEPTRLYAVRPEAGAGTIEL